MPIAQKILIGSIILLIILAILIVIIKRRGGAYRGLLNNFYAFCSINALVGLILLFFNYEGVPFFAARFWFGLWILEIIVWLSLMFKKLKSIPQQKKRLEQEKELKKYLP